MKPLRFPRLWLILSAAVVGVVIATGVFAIGFGIFGGVPRDDTRLIFLAYVLTAAELAIWHVRRRTRIREATASALYAVADRLAPFERPPLDLVVAPAACWHVRATPLPEPCADCGRVFVIGYGVARDVWRAVVDVEVPALCPECFDARARARHVRYAFASLVEWPWHESREA